VSRAGGRPTVLRSKVELREAVRRARGAGLTIGLVPTMGYLHEGHLSLARRARRENDVVVMSIFVNPTQFGPREDLERYPRDLERDLSLAAGVGVDVVFAPDPGEMYRPGHATWVEVEGLTETLEGAARPDHFRGVATVVTKLLALVAPDRAYVGQKDAQQALVIRRLAEDLDLGADIVVCPIVREADGLAMSSRNVYLTTQARRQARLLHVALGEAEAMVAGGETDAAAVEAAVRGRLGDASLGAIDYVAVVGADDLRPVARVEADTLVAVAVRFGFTRLLDNTVVTLPRPSEDRPLDG
jgi:pantoate--beta-alanine ligase